MVKLVCAIVDVAKSGFSININETATVGDLKNAVKVKKPDVITRNTDTLQLFVAKKDGAWLTPSDVLHGVGSTNGYKHLQSTEIELRDVGLSSEIVGQESGGDKVADEGHVHVLVEVSKQGNSIPTVFRDNFSDECRDPFFSHFSTGERVGDWLNFASLLLMTRQQKLYVRSSYTSIAAQALSNIDKELVKYAVVTGTRGIGKSVFLYFAMWRLIKDKKRVLLFDKYAQFYFDGITMRDVKQLPFSGNRQFWSPDLWCLVDSVDPTTIDELPVENCSVLLTSTLRQDYISNFMKLVPTPEVFYMPVWSKEELATIAPLFPQAAAVWQTRFESLGGVPRVVLQDVGTDPKALLLYSCSSCSLDDCIMMASIHSTQIAQTLIHIRSQEPYRAFEPVYASQLAVHVIARLKWKPDRELQQNLLGSCDDNPLASSLCRYIFEPYSMNLLEQGGTFVYRKLSSSADMRMHRTMKRERGNETIEIPPSLQPRQIAERIAAGQHANQLYMPRASKDTALDAWMPQFGGFQLTVGEMHDIKGEVVDELAKLGSNGNRLFFLLPPLYYNTFTKKAPQTVEQFAILISYPAHVD
nr:crinkler 4 [Plasmopara viticola]